MSILKQILSVFGINRNATAEQSQQSRQRITAAIAQHVEDSATYKVVYGYGFKSGITSTSIYNYAIGFNSITSDIVIVAIDTESDKNGEMYKLDKNSGASISLNRGQFNVKSKEPKIYLNMTIAYFTKEDAEDTYQLPIEQSAEAEAFIKFINENYTN